MFGTSFGTWGGGQLIAWTNTMPERIGFLGLEIFSWQLILLIIGAPGLIAAILFLMVREPPRRLPPGTNRLVPPDASFGRKLLAFTGLDALKAINMRGAGVLAAVLCPGDVGDREPGPAPPGACPSSRAPMAGARPRSATCSAR